ncbi:restriction endonuclease subunit S [Helicobacter pylori]|uniref:restriction endonuclease subunit S n=2 Tax=Helicobacter pylori TaxID=210 RepID=UPI0009A3E6CB|nr:restriction endonuclease subunit S [Helicobacter pylori]OPG55679.1 restriction endonuclease subunit S [Helicobacter pylori]QEF20637.1 restriction endonuclease subunit S [Helicobacter pylori]WRC38127.1 restriction endonuclease subunit S [Helicobacter pylori]
MDALTTPLPKNWEAVKVEDIFEIITDFSAAGSFAQQSQMVQYTNDRTNYAQLIRTTELKNGFNNTNAIYINKEAFEFLWRVNLNSDAIILPNIGINCGEIYYVDIKKLIHKHNALAPNAILLRTKKANLKFLFYAFLDTWFQKQLINIVTSSAQPKFTKTDLRDLLIPLPPLNEQIAIANILSDVDRYLYSLDALILKKESVKKALSFELLSQRKRLKGFNQAWQRVRLGDICEITTGSLDANEMVHYGKYRFYTCAKEYYFIDKYAFDTEAILISGNGAYVGYVHYYKGKFNAYQRTYVLDNFSEHIIFVKYFLTMFLQSHIQTNKNEGNTPYIVMATLKDFEIFLPPLNEQIAIANILSALDSEIISLKNKKRQFENIKKALNHDLMSAKIRVLKK